MNLDHVGIAVRSLEAALPRWTSLLGGTVTPPEAVPSQQVRVVFVGSGSARIELLEPTAPESAVGRFLERRGEGMHHVAFKVPSVEAQLAGLRAQGVRLVDHTARPGAGGHRVGFAHPSGFGGVLVEFVEGSE